MRNNHNLALSNEQIAQYQRDGAIQIKQFLNALELEQLSSGLDQVIRSPGELSMRVKSQDGKAETVMDHFPSFYSPPLQALLDDGRLAALAASLMGTQTAQLLLEQAFCKKSGPINPTPWHQDTPFLPFYGDEVIRIWMSCDPSPEDLTVQGVRGSHRWNVVYNAAAEGASKFKTEESDGLTYQGINDVRLPSPPDIERYRDSFDILSWDVTPGDVVVFHGNLLHGASGRDHYDHNRRALALTFGGPNLIYQKPPGNTSPTLEKVRGIDVANGTPVGELNNVFPIY